MTPEKRQQVEAHFRAIHEILCSDSLVRMSAGYSFDGVLADGRLVKHKFSVDGYEKKPRITKETSATKLGAR
jgi:hypothetical protein